MNPTLRHGVALVGAAAVLVLSSMTTSAAAASPALETRAAFCSALVAAQGVAPVSPATPDFTDVPASSPDYGAIEAAYEAGWVSGERPGFFDAAGELTRAEAAKMEVLALGDGTEAQELMDAKTAFTDDASIPAWARGYISEAVSLHLVSGFPDGAFDAGATLTTQDAAAFVRKLTQVWQAGAYTVAIKVAADPVAVGQRVNLSATVRPRAGGVLWNPAVTFTALSPDVVISGQSLIASTPGVYEVTATYIANGQAYSDTTALTVSGPAASLRVVAPAMVVANGTTQTQVTVDLLDAAGNLAVGDNGTKVSLSVAGSAFSAPQAPQVASSSAGVATFTLTDGSLPGALGTLVARDEANRASAEANVTAESQVPANIVLTAPAEMAVNKPDAAVQVEVALQDATGQAVLSGTFPLTVSLQGPATFPDGTTAPETVVYQGNGQGGSAAASTAVAIQDEQGQTGQVVVSVTAPGVPTATVSIAAVIGGRPNQLTLTPPTGTLTRDAAASGIAFGLALTDGNGLPQTTTAQVPLLVSVTGIDGAIAQDFSVGGQPQGSAGYLDPNALKNGGFTIEDRSTSADVGTYSVEVTDPAGNLAAAALVTFTVSAGAPTGIKATLASTGLWVQAPKTTLTVQVIDAYGNPVADEGVVVAVAGAPGDPYPVSVSPGSAATDASGQATFTVEASPDLANTESLDVTASLGGKPVAAFPEPVFIVEPWGP